MLDIYFDIDACRWVSWGFTHDWRGGTAVQGHKVGESEGMELEPVGSTSRDFISTYETTQITFFLEGHLLMRNDTLLVGESGSGKSWLMRNLLHWRMPRLAASLMIAPMVLC